MTFKNIFFKILILYLLLPMSSFGASQNYFDKGVKFYKEKKFSKSRIFFEKDIVFNPKSEKSYLYLAKIFDNDSNLEEQEINLNNVLLLNPQNDEAIYMQIILKIEQSDYKTAKELIEKFELVCESFCMKKNEIMEKFSKLTPENDKP